MTATVSAVLSVSLAYMLGNTDIWIQNSKPGSLSATGLSPTNISLSGPFDDSPYNRDNIESPPSDPLDIEDLHGTLDQDNIESPPPDPLDIEDLHGMLDNSDSSHADNLKDSQSPSLDSPDHGIPSGDVEDLWMQEVIHLRDLRTSMDFIWVLWQITLEDPLLSMSNDVVERLWNPLHKDPSLSVNNDTRLVIKLFLNNPSEDMYDKNRASILHRFPEMGLPSYYRTKHLVADLTGIESIVHYMYINSCIAYTGPFSKLEDCPICLESCYDLTRSQDTSGMERIPQQEFHTIPIGPQLQALYQHPESASHTHYLCKEWARILFELEQKPYLDEYSDVLHGADMIQAFQDGHIGENDIALMFSINGVQLYAQKLSSCWMYIWVLLNLSPTTCYQKQHVLIGGFILGVTFRTFFFPFPSPLHAYLSFPTILWSVWPIPIIYDSFLVACILGLLTMTRY